MWTGFVVGYAINGAPKNGAHSEAITRRTFWLEFYHENGNMQLQSQND